MYRVVICSKCANRWIIEGEQKYATCMRCGRQRLLRKIKVLKKTDDGKFAKRYLGAVNAKKAGGYEEYMEVIDDIDMDVSPDPPKKSRSHKEIIQDSMIQDDVMTIDEMVDYCESYGVPKKKAKRILEKMVDRGTLMKTSGGYTKI